MVSVTGLPGRGGAGSREVGPVEGDHGRARAHELDEQDAKQLVDLRVRVKGRPEYGLADDVRLLWVDEIETLD